MDYQVAIQFEPSALTERKLRGELFLRDGSSVAINSPGSLNPINLGIRGYDADGDVVIDLRLTLAQEILRPNRVISFTGNLPADLFRDCFRLQVAFVQEGIDWIAGNYEDTHFDIDREARPGHATAKPLRHYNADFFGGHEIGKIAFAVYYLHQLRKCYDDEVTIDFAFAFFLGRAPDAKGRVDARTKLHHEGCVSSMARFLCESDEFRARVANRPLADPRRTLAVWTNEP